MVAETRGIRIALSRASWELICESLGYLGSSSRLGSLEGKKGDIAALYLYLRCKVVELDRPRKEEDDA